MSIDHVSAVNAVIEETAAPLAEFVDSAAAFPRAAVDALAKNGLLGLMSATEVGGSGGTLADGAYVIERLAGACGSTAMVTLMHYAGTALVEAHGSEDARRAIGSGEHLTTLAFSERGSRSHFWTPVSVASKLDEDTIALDALKSWVTSAGEAHSYVWSSRPVAAEGPMTLWHVPREADGLSVSGPYDGLGLRGNASSPMTAASVRLPTSARLGGDGAGLDIALATVLPVFLVLNAAFSVGLMQALIDAAAAHLTGTRLEHLDQTLAEQPSQRSRFALLSTRVDQVRVFLQDTLIALGTGREDATLRVLQVKAVAAEASSEVADGVMRLCGGSAFRRENGIERRFRDSLAARVMAPTTEALQDFVGRARLGQPLF
jgi:isovaleryl-CoA dehydrogenase